MTLLLLAVVTRAPNRWELRVPLVLALLAVLLGVYALMRRGWQGRQVRQAELPPLPPPPAVPARLLLPEAPGLFLGTTGAGDWLDRVAVQGLSRRAAAVLALRADGLWIERTGEPALHLPGAAVRRARVDGAHAGKVVGAGGVLVVTWEHGGRELDTGFRATDPTVHRTLARSVNHLARTDDGDPGRSLPVRGGTNRPGSPVSEGG